MPHKINIAVFASGTGSNARNIINFFKDSDIIEVALLVSNRVDSGVPAIAKDTGVPFYITNRDEFYNGNKLLDILQAHNVRVVVLAGFLWLVPGYLVKAFPNRLINIHPALLPKYGGKGMYGMHVHRAVKENQEPESGITIHLVNEEYDRGEVLFQAGVALTEEDTPESIAAKIHALEYRHFPEVIEQQVRKEFFS